MADTHNLSTDALVRKVLTDDHADLVREAVSFLCHQIMEAEVSAQIGAGLGERAPAERATQRNGYRERRWDTRAGTLDLFIPKVRQGSYFPSFLEPRTRAEQALVAVVMESYVNGVSTRKVERVVEQLGVAGMSKSQVSRMCAALDEQVVAFRERPLEGAYPYLWLDAKVEKVRDPDGRVRRKALVVAYAVHEAGYREVIALDVGATESKAFWREFLRSLVARGLHGVELVVSDQHEGLKAAIGQILGCPWQRCTVHFLREMLGHVHRGQQGMVGAALRQVFQATSGEQARQVCREVIVRLESAAPKVAALLTEAEDDLLAFYAMPAEHWSKLRSTNPLERVNREIGRRTDVVGILPNDAALLRLAASLLIEQNDEWLVGRRYLSEGSMALVLGRGAENASEPAALTGKVA
ncbi:MAG: IS256 family transposase [Thermoleophilia bacterium]